MSVLDFYLNDYAGFTIPEDEFEYYEKRASERISAYTLGRAEPDDETTKTAICAIADILYESEGRQGLSSESVDGYSATYNDLSGLLYQTAQTDIPESLFYRGVIL